MATADERIETVDLYPEERAALLDLLTSLGPEEWRLPTVCPGWSVHDLALHLLWDDLSALSRHRDGWFGRPEDAPGDLSDWGTLVAFIDGLNDAWLRGARRVSPRLTIDLLRLTGARLHDHLRTLDLDALGEPVSWAGPNPAPVWLDVARDYAERWVHQQQIRDAVGKPGCKEPRLFFPVLDAFARALPHALRDNAPPPETCVRLVITGDAGGIWTARRGADRWRLDAAAAPTTATVTLDQELAWRLFTKGIAPAAALDSVELAGDRQLGLAVARMVTILA